MQVILSIFREPRYKMKKGNSKETKIQARKSTMLSSFLDCCKIGGNICNDNVDVKGVTADNNFSYKYEHDKPLFMP